MIKDNILIEKYSKAAFLFAKKNDVIEVFLHDLDVLSKAFSVDLIKSLSNPFVVKKSILDSINWVCDNNKISKHIRSFIKIIAFNKRLHLIQKIHQDFLEKFQEENKIKNFEVYSRIELEKDHKSKIEKAVEKSFPNNKIDFSYKIDEKILGGLLLKQKNIIIDATMNYYLNKLESHLTN